MSMPSRDIRKSLRSHDCAESNLCARTRGGETREPRVVLRGVVCGDQPVLCIRWAPNVGSCA